MRRGVARLGLASSLACLWIVPGCERAVSAPAPAPQVVAQSRSYAHELANLQAAIAQGEALVAKRPENGLLPFELVNLYLERARLTGDYADYRRAEALLDAQPAALVNQGSHCLARAKLHYTLHRLKQASAALAACPPTVSAPDAAALRADIALYSGRYREAEETYRALVNQLGGSAHFTRLALLRKAQGSPGEAAALFEAAENRFHGVSATMKAWLKLQRGLVALDQGHFEEALALYRLAEEAMPGWWLVDEHIAEVTRLRGNPGAAKTIYESVIERTGSPEFMDALAALEHAEGHEDRARQLLDRATAVYEKRLVEFPEAAAGHALDHYFQRPEDAPKALAIAESNYRTRPYGQSAIGLAKARILSGKPRDATRELAAQLALGWDTAEAHWVMGEALERSGKKPDAEAARARALAQNPESARMYALPR